MSKPARAKLTIRQAAPVETVAPVETAPVETTAAEAAFVTPECYARNGTEVLFNGTAAVITHDGRPGDTEEGIAQDIDGIFFVGAFAELRATGVFLTSGGDVLNDPANFYSMSVDATLLASIDEQTKALDAAAMKDALVASEPLADDGFMEDTVFSGTQGIAQLDAEPVAVPAVGMPEGEIVDFDFTGCDITFAVTKNGAPFATIRNSGLRTTMAFGPVAEAIRDLNKAYVVIAKGRATDKIVAVQLPGNDDFIVEPRKAA